MHSEKANPQQIPKLLQSMEDIRKKHAMLDDFSNKNGYTDPKPAAKRRRGKSTADA